MSNSKTDHPALKAILNGVTVLSSVNSSYSGCQKGLSLLSYTCKLLGALTLSYSEPTVTSSSIAKGLRDLATQSNCARYASNILSGPISCIEGCLSDSWSQDLLPESGLKEEIQGLYPFTRQCHPIAHMFEKMMPWTMAVFYSAEFLAYASCHMPDILYNPGPEKKNNVDSPFLARILLAIRNKENWHTPAQFSALSCFGWLNYVIFDIIVQMERCYRILVILEKLSERGAPEGVEIKYRELLFESKLRLFREVVVLLPAFAWSWPDFGENPKVPEHLVHGLMWVESLTDYVFYVCNKAKALGKIVP